MKWKLPPALLCILSVVALILVCFLVMPGGSTDDHAIGTTADDHAGHDHATGTTTKPDPNRKAKDCYTLEKNQDGTYSYTVMALNGGAIMQEKRLTEPVDIEAVSDDLVRVSGQDGPYLSDTWSVFCNVRTAQRSPIFTYVLGAGETQVAYVDFLTDKYHVFVCDPFGTQADRTAYTLEDIQTVNGQELDLTCKQEGDTLTVTYPTEDGKKTVTIKLK